MIVDGEVVSLNVGRLVVDEEGNFVFEAGSHGFYHEDVGICGLLAGCKTHSAQATATPDRRLSARAAATVAIAGIGPGPRSGQFTCPP